MFPGVRAPALKDIWGVWAGLSGPGCRPRALGPVPLDLPLRPPVGQGAVLFFLLLVLMVEACVLKGGRCPRDPNCPRGLPGRGSSPRLGNGLAVVAKRLCVGIAATMAHDRPAAPAEGKGSPHGPWEATAAAGVRVLRDCLKRKMQVGGECSMGAGAA